MKTYIAYYRVSTRKQGNSGLGLEAQRAAVTAWVGDNKVVGEYTEIESGKINNRPQLVAAIEACQRHGAILLVSKIDRLSRKSSFVMDLEIPFEVVGIPELNTLTKGIYSTIAQHESETISTRTKAALAAKKARGEQLGNTANLTAAGRLKGQETRQNNAKTDKANVQAKELIQFHHEKGKSLREIAKCLNSKGYATRRGCQFTAAAVQRLLK